MHQRRCHRRLADCWASPKPNDRAVLQAAAGVEGAGAWVHSGADFGADGRRVQVRPLGLEAAELGHGALQLPAKGAVLEGGEEGVEVRL